MFDNIHFTHTVTERPLSSERLSPDVFKSKLYDPDNLSNSEFFITGSIDAFLRPPVTEFAKENLCYMQAFNIFHYDKGSYTLRQNYQSFLILYTYSGVGQLDYCGKKYNFNTGDGVLIDCRKLHYYKAVEDWSVAVLHFKGAFSEFACAEYEKFGSVSFHEPISGGFHKHLEELISIYDSQSLHRDLYASHSFEEILLYLLTLKSNQISPKDMPYSVQQALKYLETNYTKNLNP